MNIALLNEAGLGSVGGDVKSGQTALGGTTGEFEFTLSETAGTAQAAQPAGDGLQTANADLSNQAFGAKINDRAGQRLNPFLFGGPEDNLGEADIITGGHGEIDLATSLASTADDAAAVFNSFKNKLFLMDEQGLEINDSMSELVGFGFAPSQQTAQLDPVLTAETNLAPATNPDGKDIMASTLMAGDAMNLTKRIGGALPNGMLSAEEIADAEQIQLELAATDAESANTNAARGAQNWQIPINSLEIASSPTNFLLQPTMETFLSDQAGTFQLSDMTFTAPQTDKEFLGALTTARQDATSSSGSLLQLAQNTASQISGAIQTNVNRDEVSIQLDPPELGVLQIRFQFGEGGQLLAQLNADQDATRQLLKDHEAELRNALANAGFTDVDLQYSDQQDGSANQERPFSFALDPNGLADPNYATPDAAFRNNGDQRPIYRLSDRVDIRV